MNTSERPKVIQIKIIFPGGEAWQDKVVRGWTENGHPMVDWKGKLLIVTPHEWRVL
jgi:hypothetical protein